MSGPAATAQSSRFADFPTRPARLIGLAIVLALIALGLARRLQDASPALAVPAAVVAALGCGLSFRAPRRLVLPAAAVATAGVAVLGHATSSNIGWFVVCVLAFWCVMVGSRPVGAVYWAGAVLLFAGEALFAQADPGWGAWIGGTTFAVLGGYLIRHEVALLAELRAAQAGLAERAMTEERARIARELHDVIAHSLTVALLHVTSARLAVEHEPADAARALAEAERLGRESLAEVRSAVGLLRTEGERPATAPLPDATGLPALVERSRAAGADISFALDGELAAVPTTVGLALYRILQESLTNALKHAPGSAVAVRLSVRTGSCALTVDSSGAPGSGAGLGLTGMRERAESVGGEVVAGPGGRGWLVRATLPTRERRREALL